MKIEANASFAALVEKMTRAGVPICGHVGSRPQTAALTSGYASAGRTAQQAERLVADAVAMEQAGAVLLLVEAVPNEVARRIVDATTVPVIGIGAGPDCHGQVLVLQDLLGLSEQAPRFAEPVAALGPAFQSAAAEWVRRVAERRVGGVRYEMLPGELDRLRSRPARQTE